MNRYMLLILLLISSLGLAGCGASPITPIQYPEVNTQASVSTTADLELAQRFAPVLYFHPQEIYHPQPVEVLQGISRLRQDVHLWFDTTILKNFNEQDLFTVPTDGTCFIDQWFGDTGTSEYTNYMLKKEIYETRLSPHVGGPPPTAYAHIVRDEDAEHITIQYWLFYFYNDWFNKHEGDWELVEVILAKDEQPLWVVYSQHHGGVRRTWATTPIEGGTHPAVYVALGSHANYFAANEVYPTDQDIGTRQLVLVDRTGVSERMLPGVILIPTRAELAAHPDAWPGAAWLMYRGRWGETGLYGDMSGPLGPADKGKQWDTPMAWGLEQSLDVDAWYKNRLRVQAGGPLQERVVIQLTDTSGAILPGAETFGDLALLHVDPPVNLLAHIDGTPGAGGDVVVSWPDALTRRVTSTQYSGVTVGPSGHAELELSSSQAILHSGTGQTTLPAALVETFTPVWDAPSSVIVGDILPIHEILGGFLLAFIYSLVPVLVLIAILYWIDRYQREPLRMIGLAFLWGAIPALLVSFLLQLFLKLPPNLLGPNALQALRLGLLAPVLEEALKAAGVLVIYWRWRREVNDVLDGIIYGAIVGFGFAFISNFARYAGNFFAWGYPALNLSFIAERTAHILDHGLYTAIFGAGLGFALSAKTRRRFWGWVLGGLALAIITHAVHNLVTNSLVGLNVFSVLVTGLGTLLLWAVVAWSLVKQRRLLRKELQGRVHASLYDSVQGPLARTRAQWHTLHRQGFRAWLRLRRVQGLCIRLANLHLQMRLFPEKYQGSDEAESLQLEIKQHFDAMLPLAR